MAIPIVVADHQELTREGLKVLVGGAINVVAEATNDTELDA